MKVKELIEKLSTLDPELEVMVYDRGMERSTYVNAEVRVRNVVRREINCIDAFDYMPYTATVIREMVAECERENSFQIVEIR